MATKILRVAAAGAGFMAALIIGAIAVTVVDLYLSGHGVAPLGHRPFIGSDAAGIHLSVADALVLGAAGGMAAVIWMTMSRIRVPPPN